MINFTNFSNSSNDACIPSRLIQNVSNENLKYMLPIFQNANELSNCEGDIHCMKILKEKEIATRIASSISYFDDFDDFDVVIWDAEKDLKEETDFRVIEYVAGQGKQLIPSGSFIAQGKCGKIVNHASDEKMVIKTSLEEGVSLRREFEVGMLVNEHPCFNKTIGFFVKKDPDKGTILKEKLVLEKGIPLYSSSSCLLTHLNREELLVNLESFKDAVCFLYDRKIVWFDIHKGNLLKDEENNVRLCDYGGWWIEENPTFAFEPLLTECWCLAKTLLEVSCLSKLILATQEANLKLWIRQAKVLNKATDLERKEYLVKFFNEVISQVNEVEG